MNAEVASAVKDRFTYLDTLAAVREIRSHLHARIDKAFDLPGGGWSLVLRGLRAPRVELLLVPGSYAAMAPAPVTHVEGLSPMARELRRLTLGAALVAIRDPGGERSIDLDLERTGGEGLLRLVLELFNPGNLVLVREGIIVAVAHPRTWSHRTLRVGSEYVLPPPRGNPWTRTPDELAGELRKSRTDRTTTIASRLSFGGPIAEELLARTGLPGIEPASQAADETAGALAAAVQSLLGEIDDPPKGFLYDSTGSPIDVAPYPSARWRAVESIHEQQFASFSEAVLRYFPSLRPTLPEEPGALEKRLGELRRQRDQKVLAIKVLDAEARTFADGAEALFAHYQEAEARLNELRKKDDDGSTTVEIDLDGRAVPLRTDRSVRESAQDLYERAKRVQAKLAGAQAALKETQSKIESVAVEAPSPRTDEASRSSSAPRRKSPWFEQFRWFISSEGALVVGGRDAQSNDRLVRRYLREGDRYVHADIHGAASVIVKHPAPGLPSISDVTMLESGQWGIAYSKAWRAGLASGSAFWVDHDQVSKTAGSGEFVAKGAWVIQGTKHLMKDLPIELAIGTQAYEGVDLWTVGPPSALRSRGKLRFLLTPGPDRERGEREKELARDLGLPRTRIQGLLPAGGLTIRLP